MKTLIRRRWFRVLALLALAGLLCYAILLGISLSGAYDQLRGDPQVMVILGCRVMPWGPSILLEDRMDKALDYLEEHPDVTVVASGGQGADEPMTEARAIHDYLVEHGFPSEQILLEERSTNTYQNLRFSKELLEEAGYDVTGDIVVVSNGFHLTRVRMLWNRVWGSDGNLSLLAAPTSHAPSRWKMYIREPIGLVKSFLLDHDLF